MTVDLFSSSSPPERMHGFCLWIPRVACTQCFKKFGLSWEIKCKSQNQRCLSEQYSLGSTVHKALHLQHPERDIPPRVRRRPRGALSGAQQLRRCTWGRPLTSWRGALYEPPVACTSPRTGASSGLDWSMETLLYQFTFSEMDIYLFSLPFLI